MCLPFHEELDMTTRSKAGDGAGAIVPSFFETEVERLKSEIETEVELLRRENEEHRERIAAQSYAIKCLNKTLRFLIKTLHQPLTPRQETRTGRHSR